MINVFENTEIENVVNRKVPTYKWVNLTGASKSGKTEFCVKLMDNLRTIYFDFEKGTKTYAGNFLEINSLPELRKALMSIEENINSIKPDLIVLDPLDRLTDLIAKWYIQDKGITNLSDMPFGQGWSDTRDILSSIISYLHTLAPLLITITHLKLSVSGKEGDNLSYLDMDLPGKTKAYVQNTADGHCIMRRKTDESGKNYLSADFDQSSTNDLSFGGNRWKPFYEIHTADKLAEEIIKHFKQEETSVKNSKV